MPRSRPSLLALLLSLGLAVHSAIAHNTTVQHRVLASSTGHIAACYSPMHSQYYPIGQQTLDRDRLSQAIDDDFALMAKHVTHVRTFYSQFFGLKIVEHAARHGLKVYLGVYMTSESWGATEIDAAVDAVTKFPGTVEAVLVGNENLFKGVSADAILGVVKQIRGRVGSTSVKFGTVQRITEYMDVAYDAQTSKLEANLDILGVNIYPFFDKNFDVTKPAALTDTLWNNMAKKFPVSKMRLTETGFPTAGNAPDSAPNVVPSLEASYAYYEALRQWTPKGGEGTPKFWFAMFDRRPDDNTMGIEFEKHFGFYTHDRTQKRGGYPLLLTDAPATSPAPTPSPTEAPTAAPTIAPSPTTTTPSTPNPVAQIAFPVTTSPDESATTTPKPSTQNPAVQVELPVSRSPNADATTTTTPTPTQPTPAPTFPPEVNALLPTPAATSTKPLPTPAATWGQPAPTPAATSTGKPLPTPAATLDRHPLPTPAATWGRQPQPTPAATWGQGKPTPAPTWGLKPTPAPSKPHGLSSSSSSSSSSEVAEDAEFTVVAPPDESIKTPSSPSSVVQNDSPATNANTKETSASASHPHSGVVLALGVLVSAIYML